MLPALRPAGHGNRERRQRVHDLKGCGLLPLQTERIDRIDKGDRLGGADVAYQAQGVVEIALDRQHPRPWMSACDSFAQRDLAFGDQDVTAIPARAA